MRFDSFVFWVFLAAVWLIWRATPGNSPRKLLLTAASYAFYAFAGLGDTLLLAGVTLWAYFVTHWTSRAAFLTGVAGLVALLTTFKASSYLPLGISFYVFQALSYVIDVRRGHLKERPSFRDFVLYMSWFPRLIAGPIVRAEDFLPQLKQRTAVLTSSVAWEALTLLFFGLFKKVAIADRMSLVVDPVFNDLSAGPERLALAAYAFAAQIYFDFSGYSDMAIGASLLFGYRLPVNFNWPYLALNPVDFWRRWHITLSDWLRDYVYFSLPGLRPPHKVYAYTNLVITMAICGLWHGWGATFVAWGVYHGLLLVGYRLIRPRWPKGNVGPLALRQAMSILFTFHLALAGWVVFRAERFADVGAFARGLVENQPGAAWTLDEHIALLLLASVAVAHVASWRRPLDKAVLTRPWNPYILLAMTLLALVMIAIYVPTQVPFLYFRF